MSVIDQIETAGSASFDAATQLDLVLRGKRVAEKLLRYLQEENADARRALCNLAIFSLNDPTKPEDNVKHEAMIEMLGISPVVLPPLPAREEDEVVKVFEGVGTVTRYIDVPARRETTQKVDAAMHKVTPADLMVVQYFAQRTT